MTDNERIAVWMGWMPGEACCYQPGRDILRWHGKDALFQKIADIGLMFDFMIELGKVLRIDTGWAIVELEDVSSFVTATPEQLTAALVAVIKEA